MATFYDLNTDNEGPVNRAFRERNSLEKQQLENKYYGPTQMAEIASKNTYAKLLEPQILSQFLSNPQVWQNTPREQLQAMTQRLSNSLMNPPTLEQLSGMKKEGPGLLTQLLNKMSGHESAAQQQPQNGNALSQLQSMYSPGQLGGDATNSITSPPTNTDNVVAQPRQSYNSADSALTSPGLQVPPLGPINGDPSTSANVNAAKYNFKGAQGIHNPSDANKVAQGAAETGANTEAQQRALTWRDSHESARRTAEAAQLANQYAEIFKRAVDELGPLQKGNIGSLLSKVFPETSGAKEADAASRSLANVIAQSQSSGTTTDYMAQNYQTMKPTRFMDKDAIKRMIDFIESTGSRNQEKVAFNVAAEKDNITPQEANVIWRYYNYSHPYYDVKNQRVNNGENGAPDYLETWEDFLSNPEKRQEALLPSMRKKVSKAFEPSSKNEKIQKALENAGQGEIPLPPQPNMQLPENQGTKAEHVDGDIGYVNFGDGKQPIKMRSPSSAQYPKGLLMNIDPKKVMEALKEGFRQVE
jgi:hypothetical protein